MLTKGGRIYAFYIRFGCARIVVVILLPEANEKAAWVLYSGVEEPVSGVKDGSTARNGSVQRGDCLEQM